MERIDDLQLNNLLLVQDSDMFMFGTDSVLLASFAKVKNGHTVLDIGTGNGVLCFLMHGRNPNATYHGIDIQQPSIALANKSKELNKTDNITFEVADLLEYNEKKIYDIIVCNPPYEKLDTGFICKNEFEKICRYEYKANLDDIILCVKNNLKPNGKLFMIYKAERISELCNTLSKNGIELKTLCPIMKNANTPPRLILVECVSGAKSFVKWLTPFIMYDENGELTSRVKEIYNGR